MRADAAKNVEAVVSAARELFGERGPDAPLDDVAKRAGIGNATLYRHFPARGDLLVAVYADEVAALNRQGAALVKDVTAVDALFDWLDHFVVHVATKRALAVAITEDPAERRTALFEQWHDSMRSTAEELFVRARDTGVVRPDLTAADVLALVSAAAVASADAGDARRLLRVLWHGFTGTGTGI
ncbi:helix-turn-helix domain-containing protein [Amycolatopsis minnesotensis]|uniref:TetR/AcrR family transcriptional regulator n=1 Tax=Amycolatopsis minnesotensis TaxID=337894 RepID=A0ABP5DZI3_9PSEU